MVIVASKRSLAERIALLQQAEIVMNRLNSDIQCEENQIEWEKDCIKEQNSKIKELTEGIDEECQDKQAIRRAESEVHWHEDCLKGHESCLKAMH